MDWLQIIADIAQIVGVIWLLVFGGKALIDVIRDSLKGRPIRMPTASTVTNVLLALILLAIVSLRFALPSLSPNKESSTATPTSPSTVNTSTPTLGNSSFSPTVNTTPTPCSTPCPLYHADFSQGDNGWLSNNAPQWNYDNTNKVLASDGNSQNMIFLVAPYQPTTANYAVEAQIQYLGYTSTLDQAFFGIFVRSGADENVMGYDGYYFENEEKIRIADDPNSRILTHIPYSLDHSWHTYRIEVKGNTITFYIDNQKVGPVTDNTFSSPGLVGLEDSDCQLNVRSFTVFPL